MNQKDLIRLGVPHGEAIRRGIDFISRYVLKGSDKSALPALLEAIVKDPTAHVDDPLAGEFAKALLRAPKPLRKGSAPWRQWGEVADLFSGSEHPSWEGDRMLLDDDLRDLRLPR